MCFRLLLKDTIHLLYSNAPSNIPTFKAMTFFWFRWSSFVFDSLISFKCSIKSFFSSIVAFSWAIRRCFWNIWAWSLALKNWNYIFEYTSMSNLRFKQVLKFGSQFSFFAIKLITSSCKIVGSKALQDTWGTQKLCIRSTTGTSSRHSSVSDYVTKSHHF